MLPILGLNGFPNQVWQTTSVMIVTGFGWPNGLTRTLPSNNLRQLIFDTNEMPSISNKPFEYCGSLAELTLTRLHLAQLTEQSLLGLGSLKKLDMSYNQFAAFPENVFQWLGSLLELNLAFNYLFDDVAMAMMLETCTRACGRRRVSGSCVYTFRTQGSPRCRRSPARCRHRRAAPSG